MDSTLWPPQSFLPCYAPGREREREMEEKGGRKGKEEKEKREEKKERNG